MTTISSAQEIDRAEVRRLLGEATAQTGEYGNSIEIYREALRENPSDPKAKADLADVLSWDRQYAASLKLYDELLKEDDDPGVRLKKARVLGWAHLYAKALNEYRRILDARYDKRVDLEMRAKQTYWSGRLVAAVTAYRQWLEDAPEDLEALFDLGQIYSSLRVWPEARRAYDAVLRLAPSHARARESRQKVEALSRDVSALFGYEFFESDSSSRQSDMRSHSLLTRINVPVNDRTVIGVTHTFSERMFSDHRNVTEHQLGLNAECRFGTDWLLGGHYDVFSYDRGIPEARRFGEGLTFTAFDLVRLRLSHDRERLVNNSAAFRDGLYRDRYSIRADLEAARRLKFGADQSFIPYSDSNKATETGVDARYIFSFEPEAVFVQYRYQSMDFNSLAAGYFSPSNFWTQTATLGWKHDFTGDEIFWGARRTYTDLACDIVLDSDSILTNKITGAFVWDVSHSSQFRAEVQKVSSQHDVYRDQRALISARVFF
jgi:tetratricopeptide (TPR) repeat protein